MWQWTLTWSHLTFYSVSLGVICLIIKDLQHWLSSWIAYVLFFEATQTRSSVVELWSYFNYVQCAVFTEGIFPSLEWLYFKLSPPPYLSSLSPIFTACDVQPYNICSIFVSHSKQKSIFFMRVITFFIRPYFI